MGIVRHLPNLGEAERLLLEQSILIWHAEVKTLLPDLPANLKVEFDNSRLIDKYGVGGFAASKDKIELAFNPGFIGNKEKQLNDLRGSYFHENYHVVQGFVGNEFDKEMSAIDNAIYEGTATRFESLRAKTNPSWGEYPDRKTVMSWLKSVLSLPKNYDWGKWKFYDPETGNRWIIYRVGVFIVDEALAKNPTLKIEDLVKKSPAEILEIAELSQ